MNTKQFWEQAFIAATGGLSSTGKYRVKTDELAEDAMLIADRSLALYVRRLKAIEEMGA